MQRVKIAMVRPLCKFVLEYPYGEELKTMTRYDDDDEERKYLRCYFYMEDKISNEQRN